MSITIWEPARYVEGFPLRNYAAPMNSADAAAPYNRDTKVCEIARFTGWKKSYFCDTGEFEIKTQQVTPEQAKMGNMVEIDGEMFVIEGVEWALDETGYTCTLSGRDFWAYMERTVSNMWNSVGELYAGINSDFTPRNFLGEQLRHEVSRFFLHMSKLAGWYRDVRRFPTIESMKASNPELVLFDLQNETEAEFLARSVGVQYMREVLDYAAEWRMFCNWFNVGLRFDFEWQESVGMYAIKPTIYDGSDSGISIRSDARGVSEFNYSENSRNTVNALYVAWENVNTAYTGDSVYYTYRNDDWKSGLLSTGTHGLTTFSRNQVYKAGDEKNYAELASVWSEKYLNLGQTPDESKEAAAMLEWAKQSAEAEYKPNEKTFSFKYNDTGAYKYGKDFKLGDKIIIDDLFLGLHVSQRLTGVKTLYKENALEYEFEFSNQRINQNELLRRKFSEIDRRTAGVQRSAD